jgi:hypothetical protein
MPVSEKMDRGFTKEQLDMEKFGLDFQWDAREAPPKFDPVQLDIAQTPLKCLDWWNTRSQLFCCLFPCAGPCFSGHETIDGTNPEAWKKQLENPNPDAPASMQGLWWLKYNIAHEQLVTIFGDAEYVGTFNEDGTDGHGMWVSKDSALSCTTTMSVKDSVKRRIDKTCSVCMYTYILTYIYHLFKLLAAFSLH